MRLCRPLQVRDARKDYIETDISAIHRPFNRMGILALSIAYQKYEQSIDKKLFL